MTIRLATEEDFPNIIRMAKEFHRVSPYKELPFSTESCRSIFELSLTDPSTCVIITFDHGFIVGLKSKPPFSTVTVTSELAWWVDVEHRKTPDALQLMLAYMDWSKRVNASITQMAMLDEVTDLTKFYTRHGFTPAERSYIKVN